MGRQAYSRTGYGMTEHEAYNDAMDDARRESGEHEGYSGDMNSDDGNMKVKCIKKPKPAKRCTVEKNVQKGTRKWETVFVIEARWSGRNNTYEVVKTSQGDAMKRAKEIALKTGEEMEIHIEKRLKTGTCTIAKVSPKKSERGAWRFSGDAMC